MRRRDFLLLGLLVPGLADAQEDDQTLLDDLVDQGRDWATENLDDRVDPAQVEALLGKLQQGLGGAYVIDLAALRAAAQHAIPALEANEATAPLGAWLRARLDYLDVAEQFRASAPAQPTPRPGEKPKPLPNPSPAQERKAWRAQLGQRPWPPGADKLVPRLKPLFDHQGVPQELVWVAEVESAFNPNARSPVGAAGLFQLMPATAKSLGLSAFPQDERYDPEKSAQAAAKYLGYLQGKFKNWPLRLAAYNVGEGRLRGLLDKQKARSFDAVSPYLPAETQMYVPRIEAVVLRREGRSLDQLRQRGA